MGTVPKPNLELLDRVMAQIESDPAHWAQEFWAKLLTDDAGNECGTAFCYAGWAVRLARPDLEFIWQGRSANSVVDPATAMTDDIEDVARRLLGLTAAEADNLFNEDNTFDDLCYVVEKIKQRTAAAAASDAN